MNWTNTTYGYPEVGQEYLCYTDDGEIRILELECVQTTVRAENTKVVGSWMDKEYNYHTVTHWMNLPNKPKK